MSKLGAAVWRKIAVKSLWTAEKDPFFIPNAKAEFFSLGTGGWPGVVARRGPPFVDGNHNRFGPTKRDTRDFLRFLRGV